MQTTSTKNNFPLRARPRPRSGRALRGAPSYNGLGDSSRGRVRVTRGPPPVDVPSGRMVRSSSVGEEITNPTRPGPRLMSFPPRGKTLPATTNASVSSITSSSQMSRLVALANQPTTLTPSDIKAYIGLKSNINKKDPGKAWGLPRGLDILQRAFRCAPPQLWRGTRGCSHGWVRLAPMEASCACAGALP